MTCPVVELVTAAARRHPSRPAVTDGSGTWTYAQLFDEIRGWEVRLCGLGLPPGAVVALVSAASASLPVAFLGARRAGLVPLLADALHGDRHWAERATIGDAGAAVTVDDGAVSVRSASVATLPSEAGYIAFSSGSQGHPKGIVGSAAGLAHFLAWERSRLGEAACGRVAQLTSPSFDVALRDMFLPLVSGGELVVAPRVIRSSPRAVLPWMRDNRIDVVHLVPSLSALWMDASGRRRGEKVAMPQLRFAVFAGEPLYSDHVARWREYAPNAAVLNLYGPTETTLAVLCFDVPDRLADGLQPVGEPLPDVDYSLEQQLDGGAQVIELRTPFGSLGYLPATASADRGRLVRRDGVTIFRTSDLGYVDDHAQLVVTGRTDSLVKRRGVFIDLSAVESAARRLAGVHAACCVLVDPGRSARIVLLVAGPHNESVAALRRAIADVVGMDAFPDVIAAVDRLPELPSGKVDRRTVETLARTLLTR